MKMTEEIESCTWESNLSLKSFKDGNNTSMDISLY